ncbi:hypothetical protein J6I39_03955 [bacterium]|nr:hypothetical protein [bacterium]
MNNIYINIKDAPTYSPFPFMNLSGFPSCASVLIFRISSSGTQKFECKWRYPAR